MGRYKPKTNPSTNTFTSFKHDSKNHQSISGDDPYRIFVDSKKQVWIETLGNGLNLFDTKAENFKRFGEKEGLSSAGVYCMEEDNNGNYWIGTGKGINKLNPTTGEVIVYDVTDGLQENEFNISIKDDAGYFYFGGVNGISRFHPDSIRKNSYVPPTVLTKFLLFNKPVTVSDSSVLTESLSTIQEITLTHDQYIFGFEFVGLNYRQSTKNQYKYKLAGFDPDWIETNAQYRRATYTDLDADTYTFMVKSANDDGFWNEIPTTIKVIILPPWYLTWWAKSLWVILVIGSILSFYFWRVNTLKRQKRVLEQQVKDRTEEISTQAEQLLITNEKLVNLNQFKEDMGNMVVHDFKAPLNAILWHGKENEKVQASASRLQHLLENFLDVHRVEQAKLQVNSLTVPLQQIIQQALKQTESLTVAKSIEIQNEVSPQLQAIVDEELILRVLVNLLSNAIKYTPTKGIITLSTDLLKENQLRFAVRDTGQGIPQDKLESLFEKYAQVDLRKSGQIRSTGLGLTFCKIAIEAHGGSIWVESQEGEGSVFYFTLQQANESKKLSKPTAPQETKTSTFSLNPEEQELVAEAVQELLQIEDIQLGDIHNALNPLNIVKGSNLDKWKENILAACFAENEERLRELLGVVE